MATEVKLPNLGENIESGDVITLLVAEGDEVQAEQGLLELATDKATLEVPSPSAGRIAKIHVAEGDTVPIGGVIVTLEASEPATEAPSAPPPEPVEETQPSPEAASAPTEQAKSPPPSESDQPTPRRRATDKPETPESPDAKSVPMHSQSVSLTAIPKTPEGDVPGDGRSSTAAGPAVRRLARQLGVDLRRVRPAGSDGRITREDVEQFVREANQRSAAPESGTTPPGDLGTDAHGAVRRQRMSRMRQTIARNMLQSYTTVPQLTNFDDADVTELEKIRQESKADYEAEGIKLTTMPFLIKAVASALKHHPVINASLDEEANEVVYKEYVNIGIAVDTERGLLVPVMRDADRLNIPRIAAALSSMAQKARSGDFAIEDLRGGTFTISNLGAIGGTYSTPIINPPEVAILLAGRTRKLPVFVGETIEGRLMMPLSITYDHRVVDGAAAARFLNDVKDYLSAPGRLLLAP